MRWWLKSTLVDIDRLIPISQAAEAAGFTGLSLGDHLVFPKSIASTYPYSASSKVGWGPEVHWPDAPTAIAAMAAAT